MAYSDFNNVKIPTTSLMLLSADSLHCQRTSPVTDRSHNWAWYWHGKLDLASKFDTIKNG